MAIEITKELLDSLWEVNAEPDGHPQDRTAITLHFNRYVIYPTMLELARKYESIMSLVPEDRIVVAGCSFGWSVEALAGMGYTVVGCDTSGYVQTAKDMSEDDEISAAIRAVGLDPANGPGMSHFNRLRGAGGNRAKAPVLNESSSTAASRNRVRNALGGTPTVIITEDLMPFLTDAECSAVNTFLRRYSNGTRICHYIVAKDDPQFNNKTAEEWKALFPDATIIYVGEKEQVI